jgi:hypothetical protein
MGNDLAIKMAINVDKIVLLGMLGTGSNSRRDGLVGGQNLLNEIVSPIGWLLSGQLRRHWKSPGIPRLVGNNTWGHSRMNSITMGDGHESRSSSNRGWENGSGCSIISDHTGGRMLIGLVNSSSLER